MCHRKRAEGGTEATVRRPYGLHLCGPARLASVDEQFLRDALAAHLDFALVLADGGQVVGKLHSQPCLLRAAEGLG